MNELNNRVNFIGFTYCPLKHTFREEFEEVYKAYAAKTGDKAFTYHVPSGCGGEDPFEELWKADKLEELPEIIVSVGFGDFFRKEFVEKFVNKGNFKAVPYGQMSREFTAAGIIDPDGWYTVYSVFPLVMLIDKRKLDGLPIPQKWDDLLSPAYSNNIILGASHGDLHEDLLLYIHKEHGDEGIKRLAANVKTGWHASQMAKTAGTNSSEGAAIYVIPWMFAKSCPRTEQTEIVWPADGALTTPNYILAKKNALTKYSRFLDFITGVNYGTKSANNYFPVLNAQVNNKLPAGAAFKWLGWDYIKSNSMDELKLHVLEVFNLHWERQLKEVAL